MSALDALLKRMLDQEANQANSRNRLQTMPQASYTTTPGAGAQQDADRQMADARNKSACEEIGDTGCLDPCSCQPLNHETRRRLAQMAQTGTGPDWGRHQLAT